MLLLVTSLLCRVNIDTRQSARINFYDTMKCFTR